MSQVTCGSALRHVMTVKAQLLTFRKCVDVCVTFRNDPNNQHTNNINSSYFTISPVIGLEQALHLLEKSCAKQSAQKGLSSLEVNLWPARILSQLVQVKHSLW